MPPPELHYFSHSVRKEKGARAKRDTICYSVRGNKNSSQPCQKSGLRMQTAGSDSSLVSRRFVSPAHAHVHAQWPGGLRRALWMKKRSHLSDSSLLHLAASFKNTLYSSLRLKLHLTDSMMESTILPPFLPPPSLPPSFLCLGSFFCLFVLAANSSWKKKEKQRIGLSGDRREQRCVPIWPLVCRIIWDHLGTVSEFGCLFQRGGAPKINTNLFWTLNPSLLVIKVFFLL